MVQEYKLNNLQSQRICKDKTSCSPIVPLVIPEKKKAKTAKTNDERLLVRNYFDLLSVDDT